MLLAALCCSCGRIGVEQLGGDTGASGDGEIADARSPDRDGAIADVPALDVPIVHKAVEWWRGQHPQVFGPGKKAPLAPEMMKALLVSGVAFFLLLGLLLLIRTRLATLEDRAQSLSERAAGEGI